MKVAKDQIVAMIKEMAISMAENKIFLTELDSAIGDGDHGINMDRDFAKYWKGSLLLWIRILAASSKM